MDPAIQAAIEQQALQAPIAVSYPDVVPGRVVHVDGDYLAYQASGNDDTSPGEARIKLLSHLNQYRSAAGAEGVLVHLTAQGSSKGERYIVATVKPYQEQRGGHHPKNWKFLRTFMEQQAGIEGKRISYVLWNDREADDGISWALAKGGNDAVAMKDKDSRMMWPAFHVNWSIPNITTVVNEGDYNIIGPDELVYGYKWFLLQMLMGDAADHIPGLEKYVDAKGKAKLCGEKTAAALLADTKTQAQGLRAVIDLYWGYYKDDWADRFAEQACLLWMRRDDEASTHDWARYIPEGTDAGDHIELLEAALRLTQRVKEQRAQVNAITNQGGT